ncbi:MAG: hypothetical protein INR73_20600 [Williamsia sp.]|nr:hypothetical protein [Williamsia sp.]
MHRTEKEASVGGSVVLLLVLLTAIAFEKGFVSDPKWYDLLYITIPLLMISHGVLRHKSS